MHDVLSPYEGCIRVFLEDVLTSPHFAAVGLCGSIGWAQYWQVPRATPGQIEEKDQLAGQLRRLAPYHRGSTSSWGLSKLRYKWLRSRVPHGAIDPADWARSIGSAI